MCGFYLLFDLFRFYDEADASGLALGKPGEVVVAVVGLFHCPQPVNHVTEVGSAQLRQFGDAVVFEVADAVAQFFDTVQGFPKATVELAACGAEGGAAFYDFGGALVEGADACGVGGQAGWSAACCPQPVGLRRSQAGSGERLRKSWRH